MVKHVYGYASGHNILHLRDILKKNMLFKRKLMWKSK